MFDFKRISETALKWLKRISNRSCLPEIIDQNWKRGLRIRIVEDVGWTKENAANLPGFNGVQHNFQSGKLPKDYIPTRHRTLAIIQQGCGVQL